jgi:hypothetical protein
MTFIPHARAGRAAYAGPEQVALHALFKHTSRHSDLQLPTRRYRTSYSFVLGLDEIVGCTATLFTTVMCRRRVSTELGMGRERGILNSGHKFRRPKV